MDHSWVLVLVVPLTEPEAVRLVGGERRTYRKLDTADREVCRSAAVMCAVCKLGPESKADMVFACPGSPA